MTQRVVEFVLDLTAHEMERRAAVVEASPGWDPGAALAAEVEAYRLLYSNLSPEQQAVYRMLVDEGVLDVA